MSNLTFDQACFNCPFKAFFSPSFLHVLHYGPLEGSKNGEEVLSFRHGLPDFTWPESDEDEPLSLVDQVYDIQRAYEYSTFFSSLDYNCAVDWTK